MHWREKVIKEPSGVETNGWENVERVVECGVGLTGKGCVGEDVR
jgi:hypothetical protein